VTFGWMKSFIKILAGLVIAAGCAVALFMAIPLPSFQRSVEVTNQFTTPIEVKCQTLDGKRERAFQLESMEHGTFVYFAGDHGGSTTIPVLIEAKILSNGVAFKRQFDLPIDNQPSGVALSEKWFESATKP
jgi:hypothetical protein